MLHGEIDINGYTLANYRIENIGKDEDRPAITKYRCFVTYEDRRGYKHETGPFILHWRGGGPLRLVGDCLARADEILRYAGKLP